MLVLTGPRQSGKITLLRRAVPEARYVSFDDPLQREVARRDPRSILQGAEAGPLLLDQIQYVPELLPYVKMAVDADRDRRGAFLLAGSPSFSLMTASARASRGALLEGVGVTERLKLFAAAGRRPALWFWRSNDGLEVDLLVEVGGEVSPVEVKQTAMPWTSWSADLAARLGLLAEP